MRDACRTAGFSLTTARALEKEKQRTRDNGQVGRTWTTSGASVADLGNPKRYRDLAPEAKKAWDDFGYFQLRYFGRIPVPWQQQAAEKVVELLETEDEEYVVVNCPPGVGKTTLFTHDIAAWVTVRNRAIRGQLGAATSSNAGKYLNRLRRSLERTMPEKVEAKEIAAGTAQDAVATLAGDFGRFRPLTRELWTSDAFIVMQYEDIGTITEKEPTWSSYGADSGFIGGRWDIVIWDDLVDPRRQRTEESREQLKQDWDELYETRLEPGGLMVLQGQRLYANDLYRYCLDKTEPVEVNDEDEVIETRPMYHHIKFAAHYTDRCAPEHHKRNSKPYPEGCCLYPRRLPWQRLGRIKANRANTFEVVYQQEDTDPESVLVPKIAVYGGDEYPGCVDLERDRLQYPNNLVAPTYSIAAADPSPTKMWGIEHWLYHPETEQRFLIDLLRKSMEAPDFLDWNHNQGVFSGVMEEWQQQSIDIGIPIQAWVVEINAAQRFLLQYDHVHRWMAKRGVRIIPHSTSRNKTDPDFGVQTVAPHWKFGRVRLPYKPYSEGRLLSMKLIEEVTTYPAARTTDLLMAHWFVEFQLPRLFHGDREPSVSWRPSWVRSPGALSRA